ncbi:MAG TPA: hypothetical protein QF564_00470 [Pirellulaceae bacterium]|jgi:hypothetical protein|nr:hypothetical protein [Pirellulaceae bacterium]
MLALDFQNNLPTYYNGSMPVTARIARCFRRPFDVFADLVFEGVGHEWFRTALTLKWQVPGDKMTATPSDQFYIGENPEERVKP